MWSRRLGRLRPVGCGVEELRRRRRERETFLPQHRALRKARREQQLVSKRLLRDDAPEGAGEGCVVAILGEAEVRGPAVPEASPAGDRGKGEREGFGQPSSRLAAP
uniref:Transmembrane and coiled-coil domains 6 n=1 Tax=Prolemur simus TaxID=1328070 RepID=A0A8C9AJY4_PROSS